jgi:hypothetical protein
VWRLSLEIREGYFNYIRSLGHYTNTENWGGFWTAGMIDSGDGNRRNYNETDMGEIPDILLTQINNKMHVSQGYLRRMMTGWNDSVTSRWDLARDEVNFYRTIAYGIVQKNSPLIDSETRLAHNITENFTILQYYSMKAIADKMYDGSIGNISYVNNSGTYNDLSEAMRQNYNFYNPLIFEEWSNGLRIYANLNRTGWWNFTANSKNINLPPNGLYAYITNDSTFEECFNCDNTSTYVITSDYVYLYPKNGQNVTFSIPKGFYNRTVFYGDDSSNGRRSIGYYYVNSINTNNVEILYPAENTDIIIEFITDLSNANVSIKSLVIKSGAKLALRNSRVTIGG